MPNTEDILLNLVEEHNIVRGPIYAHTLCILIANCKNIKYKMYITNVCHYMLYSSIKLNFLHMASYTDQIY